MKRREFIGLVGGAAAWPIAARAQQARVQRVAVFVPSQSQWSPAVFREALAVAGFSEGASFRIEVLSADSQLDRLPQLAADLVRARPDVIVAVNTPPTLAAMKATADIPIISAIVSDPVALGIVKNLARPEGNVTGVANMASDITSKRIALLKEIVPLAHRIALFMHPDDPVTPLQLRDVEATAANLAIEHRAFPMRSPADLEEGFKAAIDWNVQGIVRLAGQGFTLGAATGRRATELNLPSMLLQKSDVEAGGLMSYFADHRALWNRVAIQVGRLLKGASPRELPFELPTRFEMAISLKTAKALALTVPATLLARADEVIE
jgi:putative tryptophan/tyrosine transport system substrate-binding protein